MRNRRVALVLLAFGLVSFLRILGNPRLQALHGSDIVQLVASGMCFGGALVALLGPLTRRKETSHSDF